MTIYKGKGYTTGTKIYKHAHMYPYIHSVSPLVYRQGFIKALLMAIIQHKNFHNTIFQLSFKTQSSSIYIFCLFCFCLVSQLLEFICIRVFSNQNLRIHNIQNILKYTENENLKHLQKFKLRLATGNFCQPLNHKLLVKLRA